MNYLSAKSKIFTIMCLSLVIYLLSGGVSYAIEYEVRSKFLDPREGKTYYPGNKLFINLRLRDYNERVRSIAFYVSPVKSKTPPELIFKDEDGDDGWFTTWKIPEDAEEGWYKISAQAFDKNGVKKGNESFVPFRVKKPEVKLQITAPSRGKKIYGGQAVYIVGNLSDRAEVARRVDFYVYRASAEPPEAPTCTDDDLSSGCSARFILPEKPLDEYVILLRALDAEGIVLAEEKVNIYLIQPKVELIIAEPKRGSSFFPGQKIHIYGSLKDPAKVAEKLYFYLYSAGGVEKAEKEESSARKEDSAKKAFFVDEDLQDGFSAEYLIPYETDFGNHTLLIEAMGNEAGSPPLARTEMSLKIKKPEVKMKVLVPHQDSYYYSGEDLYVNVVLTDRASIVGKVGFVIYPVGEPMSATFTYFDKIFTDGCGVMFKIPDDVKAGIYVLEITAKDMKGKTLLQENVNFEIKE